MLLAGAVGCSSNKPAGTAAIPPNTVPPSPSAVRDLGDLTSLAISSGNSSTGNPAVDEKVFTGGNNAARGFDIGGDNTAGGGTLTSDQLGQMLQSLGGGFQPGQNGMYVASLKDNSSGLTYNMVVGLSQDSKAIYFVIPMFAVDPNGWASQNNLLQLLSANTSVCPACFGIMDQKLFLMLGVANMNVNADVLKTAIMYMVTTMHGSQQLWGPWMSSGGGNQGGGTPGAGGQGGGNGGGGQGGGNGGGGSNPFQ